MYTHKCDMVEQSVSVVHLLLSLVLLCNGVLTFSVLLRSHWWVLPFLQV